MNASRFRAQLRSHRVALGLFVALPRLEPVDGVAYGLPVRKAALELSDVHPDTVHAEVVPSSDDTATTITFDVPSGSFGHARSCSGSSRLN